MDTSLTKNVNMTAEETIKKLDEMTSQANWVEEVRMLAAYGAANLKMFSEVEKLLRDIQSNLADFKKQMGVPRASMKFTEEEIIEHIEGAKKNGNGLVVEFGEQLLDQIVKTDKFRATLEEIATNTNCIAHLLAEVALEKEENE